MPFDTNDGDSAPQPFIRQESPNKRFITRPIASAAPNSDGRSRLGCALVCFVLMIALIGIGLFLPPVALGEQLFSTPYVPLGSSPVGANGLTIAVDPATAHGDVAVRVNAIPANIFRGEAAASQDDMTWISTARTALPAALTLISPVYRIDQKGNATAALTLTLALPQNTDVTKTDLYQYDSQHNRWSFLSAHPSSDGASLVASTNNLPQALAIFQTGRLVPIINTVIAAGQAMNPEIPSISNIIHPAGLQPAAAGTLAGVLPDGVKLGQGYGVVPVIRNFADPAAVDVSTVTDVLRDATLRTAHIARLAEFASSSSYQGLAIDYRRLPADQRDNFTAFITALAERLHKSNLTLTVVVPFPIQEGSGFNTGAYDWRAIGAAADTVQILLPYDPQAFAQNGWVDSVLKWAIGEISRTRLQIGVSALSVEAVGTSFLPLSYGETLAPLGQITVSPAGVLAPDTSIHATLTGYTPQFAPLDSSGTPAIRYFSPDGKLVSTMWLSTGAVIRRRLDYVTIYNLAGALVLDLASNGIPMNTFDVISAFKVNQLADAPLASVVLSWTVSAEGTVVYKETAVPRTPFLYKSGSSTIQIGAELSGMEGTVAPVTVQVATPTPSGAPPTGSG